jgi:hypothetical protein
LGSKNINKKVERVLLQDVFGDTLETNTSWLKKTCAPARDKDQNNVWVLLENEAAKLLANMHSINVEKSNHELIIIQIVVFDNFGSPRNKNIHYPILHG